MTEKAKMIYSLTCLFLLTCIAHSSNASSSYKAWLSYQRIDNQNTLNSYQNLFQELSVAGTNPIIQSSIKELQVGLKAMLQTDLKISNSFSKGLIIGTDRELSKKGIVLDVSKLSNEGFLLQSDDQKLILSAKSDIGLLYGSFHILRLIQTQQALNTLDLKENPKIKHRLLNHWDNPGTVPEGRSSVERGYAGDSIFKWDELSKHEQRYIDYSRMLASTGINGSVMNNVNTAKKGLEGWKLLTPEYLPKLKYIAGIFRQYGIKMYISVNFFSPVIVGGLKEADPNDPKVQKWWSDKANEIYKEIPDFGGYLVKADSEGEPGPMKYGLTHADGANLLARSLKPHGGIVMWRAFVYGHSDANPDRAAQPYDLFKPIDGKFDDNAIVQIKNGPHDFQVREPVSTLFSAMPKTNQMLELQITQEYTGHERHVCYLVPQWKTIFDFDTHAKGKGTHIKKVLSGEVYNYKHSGIAGVSNIGDDMNWTGHLLAQANFYGYGRLSWDPDLSTEEITKEWILQTFGHNEKVMQVVSQILNTSWRTYEDYTMPLGIGFMSNGCPDNDDSHFSPDPSKRKKYHKANKKGLGYDRTKSYKGHSYYAGQYHKPVYDMYKNVETCPEELLLFFHHLPYKYKLKSGKTIIQHIYDAHKDGVKKVEEYYTMWQSLEGLVDKERFDEVSLKLKKQIKYAGEWRDSINSYFYKLSKVKDQRK
jgi:alpha-glucuronidase